ncbi:MAG: flagellar brake protein [Oscillospiraceae bacterium]|nr:flagellar brake protein [Oscillospiraceae bacterium]
MAVLAQIVVGDKIDLSLTKRGPLYRTKVEETTPDGRIVMALPSYKGIPLVVRRGQRLHVVFYRENGKFTAEAEVRGVTADNAVRLLVIALISDTDKEQNRDNFRVQISLKTTLYRFPDGEIPEDADERNDAILYAEEIEARTKDLSASGALVRTQTEFPIGEKLLISIQLGTVRGHTLLLPATVARAARDESGMLNVYFFGFQFSKDDDSQSLISKFVADEQKKQIKKRKLMDE